jgi:kumamolisin
MGDLREGYRPLPNSELSPAPGFVRDPGAVDPKKELTITIRVRRRTNALALPDLAEAKPTPVKGREFISREDLPRHYGASEDDLNKVKEFARLNKLAVLDATANDDSSGRRSVMVSGSIEDLSRAFRIQFSNYKTAANQNFSLFEPGKL